MIYTERLRDFTYWKRPWHKWFVLLAGILQVVVLLLNIQEYQDIAKAKILSSSAWESYAARQSLQCAINGLTAAIFWGEFLIGIFAGSKRTARMAEGVLLLVLTLLWGIAGFALGLTTQGGTRVIWGLLLLTALCGTIHAFWKSQNSE